MPALLMRAPSGRVSGSAAIRAEVLDVFRDGNVQHYRFDSVGADCVGVAWSAHSSEDVEAHGRELVSCRGTDTCRGAGDDNKLMLW